MLRKLRLRLSLLYLAAAIGLVILLGAGTYGLLTVYFQRSTDLALQYKMALEFRSRGLTIPSGLATAEQAWLEGRGHANPTTSSDSDNEESESTPLSPDLEDVNDLYDGSLAPVFVVDTTGIVSPGIPIFNDPEAISAALQNGFDLRTIFLEEGSRLRLLTYRASNSSSVLQVGRLMNDQDRLLSQYLIGLVVLGSVASFILALASWGLAGRSIKPAQRAWDQQQQFISNASHELRTPLTILRASADYALRSSSATESEQALHDILDEVDYMNRMVEDLLLLSRLDSHRLNLTAEKVRAEQLLTEIVHHMEKVAREGGVVLQLDPVSGSVCGDNVRLRQVVLILLDNALRFTPSGGTIRLGASHQGKWVIFHVTDTGIGIPAKDLPYVFDRFYQVQGQQSAESGNGLGLSIAKGLVEAQHGSISITSVPGNGTTVTIRLPAA